MLRLHEQKRAFQQVLVAVLKMMTEFPVLHPDQFVKIVMVQALGLPLGKQSPRKRPMSARRQDIVRFE